MLVIFRPIPMCFAVFCSNIFPSMTNNKTHKKPLCSSVDARRQQVDNKFEFFGCCDS